MLFRGSKLPAAVTWARLQTFVAVYETGSVRSAAEGLHVTPPAVSTTMAALESALGVTLFDKAGRGIAPTDAADIFVGYARKLLGLVTEAAAAVHEADRGRVRIGAVATASEYLLPRPMASFVATHPHVELSLSVLRRDEVFSLAANHAIDVVIAGRPPRGTGLVTRARRPNRLILVGSPDRKMDPLTTTWLLTGLGSGTRETTLSLLSQLQAAPPLLTLGTTGAALAAARHGLGVTLVPEEAARPHLDSGELTTYAVSGTPLERPWHLCTMSEPTAATRLFLQHVCDPNQVGDAAFHPRHRPRG